MGTSLAFADEGMWPMNNLSKLPFDELKARGLELGPEDRLLCTNSVSPPCGYLLVV